MKELIVKGLANVFDWFKAKNPVVALIILSAIGGLNIFIESGGTDVFGPKLTEYVQYISWVWAALQGTRTTRYVNNNKITDNT